jgi:hypothetical protein
MGKVFKPHCPEGTIYIRCIAAGRTRLSIPWLQSPAAPHRLHVPPIEGSTAGTIIAVGLGVGCGGKNSVVVGKWVAEAEGALRRKTACRQSAQIIKP